MKRNRPGEWLEGEEVVGESLGRTWREWGYGKPSGPWGRVSEAEGTRAVALDEQQTREFQKQPRVQVCRVRLVEESCGRGGEVLWTNWNIPLPWPQWQAQGCVSDPSQISESQLWEFCGKYQDRVKGRGEGAGVRMKSGREDGKIDGRRRCSVSESSHAWSQSPPPAFQLPNLLHSLVCLSQDELISCDLQPKAFV